MARPRKAGPKPAQSYRYPDADLAARPEIGAQAHFKQAKPPATYRFDSSLAPELQWDGQNPARETAEALIKEIADCGLRLADLAIQPASSKRDQEIANRKSQIADLQTRLRGISGPFLNWSGKAERLSFDVPSLPLFIHERLSTKAILETLKGHKRDKQDDFLDALYGFQERPLADQLLRAYEYRDNWVNRLLLFPRTGAWENLKKALRVEFEETVWDHLAGTTSAPFPEGEHGQIAVKVIDPRGNELLVVKKLEEAK
jgi:adenine-specific DNA-methyltransferase